MKKSDLQKLKAALEKEKVSLEVQLESFAKKDTRLKGDWDTRFPDFDGGSSGSQKMEQESDEVEAYANLLPVEHSLEKRLKDTTSALAKIKRGRYGQCEECNKPIALRRLQAFPAAKKCGRCKESL